MAGLGKIATHIYNKFPSQMTVKSDGKAAFLKWVGSAISAPENRLILGVTALVSQPWIDLYNKDVDERTRKVSCARTIAKIVAGTTTGVAIRYGTIGLAKKLSKVPELNKSLKSFQKWLMPSKVDITKIHSGDLMEKEGLKQYQNTVGTLLGLVVMTYTNFAIDVPLTKYFTKIFCKKLGVDQGNKSIDFKGGKK